MRRALLALLIGLVLAACGDGDSVPTATPDAAPPAGSPTAADDVESFPPTWTPSRVPPRATPPPTVTPAPSFTPRPSPTATPGVTPGARTDGDQIVVTAFTATINAALAEAFAAAPVESLAGPPVLVLSFGSQVSVQMVFYNAFLDQESVVEARLWLAAREGVLVVDEVPDTRAVEGPLIVEGAWREGLRLVADGLTALVMDLAGDEAGPLRVAGVRVFPDYVQMTLTRAAPVG